MKLTLAEMFAKLGASAATQTQAGAYLHALCTLSDSSKTLPEGGAMCLCTFLASEQYVLSYGGTLGQLTSDAFLD